uniref:Uncharacterized protein n=1 Tax=Magallana gigas TaxID=29159 RepID=K1RGG9_MAGGI
MVYGISKGYVYALRVLGFSKGGDGKMSPTQYFTLGGRVHVDSRISVGWFDPNSNRNYLVCGT